MSHFSVLVVADQEPTDDLLRRAMQPFHEFECTGTDDEYVQDVDITDEVREEYLDRTESRFKDESGNLHYPYDDRFYREPTAEEEKHVGLGTGGGNGIRWHSKDWGDGKGYRPKVHFCPDGWERVEVKTSELKSFRDFVSCWYELKVLLPGELPDRADEHKYGYTEVDASGEVVRVIDRTNPNKKWDYWRVGGRYAGKLQAKVESVAVAAPLSWEWQHSKPEDWPEGVDICQVANLDKNAMKRQAMDSRRKWAMKCCDKAGVGLDVLNVAMRQNEVAHPQWLALEVRPRGEEYYQWLRDSGFSELALIQSKNWEIPDPDNGQSIEDWIEAAPYLTSFAVLKDGQWYERGRMGWWACVSDEDEQWESKFNELIDSLRDDQWLAVLDCHI